MINYDEDSVSTGQALNALFSQKISAPHPSVEELKRIITLMKEASKHRGTPLSDYCNYQRVHSGLPERIFMLRNALSLPQRNELILHLVDLGVNPNFRVDMGYPLFFICVKEANTDLLAALIQRGADITQKFDDKTLLFTTVCSTYRANHFESFIKKQLEWGVDIEAKTKNGMTAIDKMREMNLLDLADYAEGFLKAKNEKKALEALGSVEGENEKDPKALRVVSVSGRL